MPPAAKSARAGPDRATLSLLAAMYALLALNAWLYFAHPLPRLAHVAIGALAIHLSFTIWHEAVHRNVSRRAWVNALVGVLGMLPYGTPYFLQRWIHLQHHARLNEPDDPNAVYVDGPFWKIFARYPRALGVARRLLAEDPRTRGERISDLLSLAAVAALLLAAWRYGRFVDLFWLWLAPLALAKLVMDWYINYLPHVGLPPHRFEGTRIVDVGWLTPLVLGHNYHAIHHLWPNLPWHRYRRVFRERLPALRRHAVPIEHRVFERRFRGRELRPHTPVAG